MDLTFVTFDLVSPPTNWLVLDCSTISLSCSKFPYFDLVAIHHVTNKSFSAMICSCFNAKARTIC